MSNQDSETFNWRFDTALDDDQTLQIRGRKLFFFVVLITIILLFTTLFLCARWIFRNSNLPRRAPSQVSSSSLPSQGLDADDIKKLPIILHQSEGPKSALEETECCICLSAFNDGEKLKVLPICEHCFHCECVDVWLANHSSCPLCRASLKRDSSFPSVLIQEPPIRYNNYLPV